MSPVSPKSYEWHLQYKKKNWLNTHLFSIICHITIEQQPTSANLFIIGLDVIYLVLVQSAAAIL